jgi:hypothetical protein
MGNCGACCGQKDFGELNIGDDPMLMKIKSTGRINVVIRIQKMIRGYLARKRCSQLKSIKIRSMFDHGHLEINQENYNNPSVLVSQFGNS